jgi:putative tricarboxylic transport membrane protein
MQLSDRVTGLTIAAIGAAAVYGGSLLPPMPGQPVGPSIFPIVVGAGLCLCGALIVLGVGRVFEAEAEADFAAHQAAPALAPSQEAWLPRLKALVPIAALLFYVVAVDTLGFVPTAFLMITAVALALGARWKAALGLAVVAPPIVHLMFFKLLRVPLPDGLLPLPW